MRKALYLAAPLAAVLAASPAYVFAHPVGTPVDQNPACAEDAAGPAVRIHVGEFKAREGQIKVQLYGDNPDDFLEKGKSLKRIVAPVDAENEETVVCLPIDAPGDYALIVIHDANANGKPDVLTEGFGLAGNGRLKLRRPKYEEGRFTIGEEVVDMHIDLQYLSRQKSKRRRGAR